MGGGLPGGLLQQLLSTSKRLSNGLTEFAKAVISLTMLSMVKIK